MKTEETNILPEFTPWKGGWYNPVEDDVTTIVEVTLRDGTSLIQSATDLRWQHIDTNQDIVAYRVVSKEDKTVKTFSKEKQEALEAFLNFYESYHFPSSFGQFCINSEGLLTSSAESLFIITEEDWEAFISPRQIAEGDLVQEGSIKYRVLFVGAKMTMVRRANGSLSEYLIKTTHLTRITEVE